MLAGPDRNWRGSSSLVAAVSPGGRNDWILLQSSIGSSKRGARGTKRVQFVLRIELGHHLVRLDVITRIYQALDNPAADPEGESDFLFRLNFTCKDDRLAEATLFDDHRTHGTWRRRVLGELALAAAEHQNERRRCREQEAAKTPGRPTGAG